MGLNPDLFTFRELVWMTTGNQKSQWIHTTNLILTMVNVQRGKDIPALKFEDHYPYSQKKKDRNPDELDQILAHAAWEKMGREQLQRK